VQLAIIQTVLTLLEKAQESRQLSGDELEFRRSLKMKILGLVVVQKARAREHSRQIIEEGKISLDHWFVTTGCSPVRKRNCMRPTIISLKLLAEGVLDKGLFSGVT
jgi:hypothetical protein